MAGGGADGNARRGAGDGRALEMAIGGSGVGSGWFGGGEGKGGCGGWRGGTGEGGREWERAFCSGTRVSESPPLDPVLFSWPSPGERRSTLPVQLLTMDRRMDRQSRQ